MPEQSTAIAAHESQNHPQHTAMETLQSLIVAFVLAMTFRGFVTEGFVIPTGSMAPTLNGRHVRLVAPVTGTHYAVGLNLNQNKVNGPEMSDPMLGPGYRGTGANGAANRARMGDRILVLKGLYPFFMPGRWDVVVFKNPTDPNGEAGNYVKRLIGLPGETIWLADGDVFARQPDSDTFQVQRKPEYVQRSVWQPISNSDYIPVKPQRLTDAGYPYAGAPWHSASSAWDFAGGTGELAGRIYTCSTGERTVIEWDHDVRELDDWTPYNQAFPRVAPTYVSDLRFAASVVPEQDGLQTSLELRARGHVYEFALEDGRAVVRYRDAEAGPSEWIAEVASPMDGLPAGEATNVEFWHVDQSMSIFIDGEEVARLEYDWQAEQRILQATGNESGVDVISALTDRELRPYVNWSFEGSALELHRVRVDRDLHYLNETVTNRNSNPVPEEFAADVRPHSPGFGTHPSKLGVLEDDHFMMLGDNTQSSSDSRVWGMPHPLVATQVDNHPFVVHRKLILGKAWVVYFPSPMPLTEGGATVIPDFGHLRFIR